MLQNLTSLGMTDIAFLVVNSKKERSQKLLPELEARVSFPVYQETSDEEIWSVLRGGKDDMFVYDRCGRMVAYLPFPLSLLDVDRSLVYDFIIYAHNVDPCASIAPCNEMETDIAQEDVGDENYTTHFLNNTQEENYEQQNLTNRTNETYSEDLNDLFIAINETTELKSNGTFVDLSSENMSHSEAQNHTNFQGIHNSIWGTQNLDRNNTIDTNFTTNTPAPSGGKNVINEIICRNNSNCNTAKSLDTNNVSGLRIHDTKPADTTQTNPKRICVAEDEKVCEQWSKRQLKRIQRCCANVDDELKVEVNSKHENICKSFQKKRCKKLRTVIKCCLKIHTAHQNDESADVTQSSRKQECTESPETELHNDKSVENAIGKVP